MISKTTDLMAIVHLLYDLLVAHRVEIMQLLHSVGSLNAYKYNISYITFILNGDINTQ